MSKEHLVGPLRKAAVFYVGERFVHKDTERHGNGAVPGVRNKAARRMIRGRLFKQQSRIERDIKKAREWRQELENLGDNSHEKKRYVEEALTERRWWHGFLKMWTLLGYGVKARAIYASQQAAR